MKRNQSTYWIVGLVSCTAFTLVFVFGCIYLARLTKPTGPREYVEVQAVTVWTQRDYEASTSFNTLFPHMIVRTTDGRMFRVMGHWGLNAGDKFKIATENLRSEVGDR